MQKDEHYIGTFDKLDIGYLITWTNQRTRTTTDTLFPLNEGKKAHNYFKNRMFALGNSNWLKIYVGTKAKTAQKRAEHEMALNWLFNPERVHAPIFQKHDLLPAGTERKGTEASPE